jgi:hypothetical protein
MHAITRFVGLDLRSMRPNAKFLIIPAAIVFVSTLFASAVLLSPYPLIPAMSSLAVLNTPLHLFGNDERGRLDTLYAALGIRRQHVVLGRYATCLLLLIALTVAGTLVAPVAALAFGAEFEWAVAAAVAAASVTLIGMMLATQLPAYFATGPGPIRIVAAFPPAIILAVMFLAWAVPDVRPGVPSWLDDANPARLTVAAIAAIATLSILGLASTTLSARLYARRDL